MRQEIQDALGQYGTEHQGQQSDLTPESDPHDCVLQEAVAFEEDVLQRSTRKHRSTQATSTVTSARTTLACKPSQTTPN